MSKDPRPFPIQPIEDWIIVNRIEVSSKEDKKKKKLDLVSAPGLTSQSIVDLENKKAKEMATYESAKGKLLDMWDEHPNQGIVKAVGPGRILEEGVKVPVPLKVGQKIYYRGQVGEPVIVNKKLYWMIKPHEVYAIVPN